MPVALGVERLRELQAELAVERGRPRQITGGDSDGLEPRHQAASAAVRRPSSPAIGFIASVTV